jgi:thiol-disulfide isomerase/thioredoxin
MQRIFSVLTFLFITAIFSGNSFGMTDFVKQSKVRAPELAGGKSWLNTEKPLSIAGLKGKVVLLDFWTYGCINCIHIIPDLKKLEEKYANNLVVIGVHSAKFDNEKDTDNIRQIVLRYGIEHPVVNDADFKIWDAYAIKAWPGLVVIDPDGYVIKTLFGEGHFQEIDQTISETIAEFRKKGQLNEQSLKFALERAKIGDLPLAFPGKVLADEKSKRLFISDSNHNRIVVTDFNGKLLETIGSGQAAKADGDFTNANFNRPQGMAFGGDNLYVADTENHLLRRVDLKTKRVETIGGTGNLEGFNGTGGDALKTALRSPWDLTLVGKMLYVAMAGSHQIWRMDLEKNLLEPYAGTRAEARIDGKINEAAFSQPSGIVSDGKKLWVADSEANIIREIDFAKQEVETLVGGDLFQFGDKDGMGDDVLLQHPLGVALYDGKVLIADTYNHKIKILDTEAKTVKTFLGTGKSGQIDGASATFYEPAGLSIADGKLFIADTNNQAIRVVDLKTKAVSTLKIEGLAPPVQTEIESSPSNAKEIKLETKDVAANSDNSLILSISLPKDFHLNPNAPQRFEVSTGDGQRIKIANPTQRFKTLPITVPFSTTQTGAANLKAKLTVYYCREDNTGVCLIKRLAWNVPLNVVADKKAARKVEISANVLEQ